MASAQIFIRKLLLIPLLLGLLFLGNYAMAQSGEQAFENISVEFSYQNSINENVFHEYWSSNPAFEAKLKTPFYAGEFFISGKYSKFHSFNDLPDFDNIQANVGWGMKFPLLNRVKFGTHTGVLFSMMKFTNVSGEHQQRAEKSFGSRSPESEIGFLLGADISYEFGDHGSIHILWNRNIVYTRHKMKLNYIGIGVSRSFATPHWLQEILK